MTIRMQGVFIVLLVIISCKNSDDPNPKPTTGGTTSERPDPTAPTKPGTMGFFLDNWTAKTYVAPTFTETAIPTAVASDTVLVNASAEITKIPLTAFGHNANTWMTTMVGEPTFMTHIKALKPNVIRFPAGSGSDAYFWNAAPGALPADVPTQLTDKDGVLKDPGYGYGKTSDNWRASLDNYYDVLSQTGSVGILTVNYGYARYGTSDNPVATAAHLAADWVRYDNGRTHFWEIGNEVYADWEWSYRINQANNKDGQPQLIDGALYAKHVKVFADSMRKAAADVGSTIYIGAVMYESEPQSYQVNSFKTWNQKMLPELNNAADFYIAHNYFTPYNENSTAATVLTAAHDVPSQMMDYVTGQMKKYNVDVKPVAMTEYNMWASGNKQQVSNTSGVFAVQVVSEAIANKYGLVARWDLLNAWNNGDDHGLFSDGSEPSVAKWTPRPSFYYLYYFQKCIGDKLVATSVGKNDTAIKAYASTFSSGEANVTLLNVSASPKTVLVKFSNFTPGSRFYWYSLEGSTDNGEFSRKVLVNGNGPTGVAGGPAAYETLKARSATTADGIKVTVPARGMVTLMVDK